MASVVRATSPRFELLSVVATNHFVLTPSPSLPQSAEEEEGGRRKDKSPDLLFNLSLVSCPKK